MSDVELADFGNRGDGGDVARGQAVSGGDAQAEFGGVFGGGAEACEFVRGALLSGGVKSLASECGFGIPGGREFDLIRARMLCGFDLGGFGVNENAGDNSLPAQNFNRAFDRFKVGDRIQAAFGRDFAGTLFDERDAIGSGVEGDVYHLVARRHFDVKVSRHTVAQKIKVAVLDVATVGAQVNGDAVGSSLFAHQSRRDKARFNRAAGFAHGCNVVNVDVETWKQWSGY